MPSYFKNSDKGLLGCAILLSIFWLAFWGTVAYIVVNFVVKYW